MTITMDKRYQTRDGRAVRILCVDGPMPSYPVIALIESYAKPFYWSNEGYACPNGPEQDWDLVPVPTKHEGWAVVYADGDYRIANRDRYLFSTEAFAQGSADSENRLHPSLTHDKFRVAYVTWES